MNPYFGKNFFQFVGIFIQRLFSGELFQGSLASDEIQLIVLLCIAISCSLVGTFLVLKRMTMLANSLSHTILLGIIIAYLLTASPWTEGGITLTVLFIAALLTSLLTTLLTQLLTHWMKLQEDASISLVFTTLFALGIVFATLFTRNTHIGIEAIMGNVDALSFQDIKLVAGVALFNLLIFSLLFKEFKITSFDSGLANSLGYSPSFFNYLLMVLVAATVIAAFRAVGVLLVLIFLVGPPLIALQLSQRLRNVLLLSVAIGSACSFIGIALSRHLLSVYQMPISTAGLIAVLISLFFIITLVLKRALVYNQCR